MRIWGYHIIGTNDLANPHLDVAKFVRNYLSFSEYLHLSLGATSVALGQTLRRSEGRLPHADLNNEIICANPQT